MRSQTGWKRDLTDVINLEPKKARAELEARERHANYLAYRPSKPAAKFVVIGIRESVPALGAN